MNRLQCVAWTVCLAAGATAARGDDWPQFHGPGRDGKSEETGLARSFPAGGPKVLWTVRMGEGYGAAAVRDGKVFVLDRPDPRQDVLRVFDLKSGEELWRCGYPAPGRVSHNGSRSVPAVDDKRVYTVGCFGEVTAFDRATHKVAWQKHLLRDYDGGRPPKWGVSQSPLLYGETIIVAPQSRTAGLVALDRATGKETWRSAPAGELQYVTPLLVKLHGVDTVVQIGKPYVTGVDAAGGKTLWRTDAYQCRIAIPNATAIGDGRLFVTGGYDAGSAMLHVARDGGSWKVDKLWATQECNSQMNPAYLIDGYLYANSNSNSDRDGLICMDLEGKVLWKTGREPNFERGHMLYADGMLIVVNGRSGDVALVRPDPEGYKELARATGLLSGKEIWAPPALSDGHLVLRDQSKMICISIAR